VAHSSQLSLVVVDDDAEVRKALSRLLKSFGHDVRVFASAEEFEAQWTGADCLILDVRLPGLNGPELRERLRLRGLSTPIIFISGDVGTSSHDIVESGIPYLSKPFDESELIAAIATAIT
jgi:FixJ family two-component response regulator